MNTAIAKRRIENHKLGDAYLFGVTSPISYPGTADECGDPCQAYADHVLVVYEKHADTVSAYLCTADAQFLEPGHSIAQVRGLRHPLHAVLAEADIDY